jgi:hypothetical protein
MKLFSLVCEFYRPCVVSGEKNLKIKASYKIPPIAYYWTRFLIMDHAYLVGNLTDSKIAGTKALES